MTYFSLSLFTLLNFKWKLSRYSSMSYNLYVLKFSDCPGTESASAGQVSACQGCPNQNICASGVTQLPDPGK